MSTLKNLRSILPYIIGSLLIGSLITVFVVNQTEGHKQRTLRKQTDSIFVVQDKPIYHQEIQQLITERTSDQLKITYLVKVKLLNQSKFEAKVIVNDFCNKLRHATATHLSTDGFVTIDPDTKNYTFLYPTDSLTVPETKIPFWQQLAADHIRYPIKNIELTVEKVSLY